MTLFDRVFGGNDYNYERTVAAVDAAIAQYGEGESVAFPDTAYSLPCYYAVTGVKINNLGNTGIVVTHEQSLVDYYKQRVVTLKDGVIVEDRVGGMFE